MSYRTLISAYYTKETAAQSRGLSTSGASVYFKTSSSCLSLPTIYPFYGLHGLRCSVPRPHPTRFSHTPRGRF